MSEKNIEVPQVPVGNDGGLPVAENPAHSFRKTESKGASAIESTSIYSQGMTPDIVAEIQAQKKSGDFRTIAGRPWWVSTYDIEDLKKAGLV